MNSPKVAPVIWSHFFRSFMFLMRQVAGERKDRSNDCKRVDGSLWKVDLEGLIVFPLQILPGKQEQRHWHQDRGESVIVQCFTEVAMQHSGECACRAAPWALQMQVRVGGAVRIEGVLIRRKAKEDQRHGKGGEEDCSRARNGYETAAGGQDQRLAR